MKKTPLEHAQMLLRLAASDLEAAEAIFRSGKAMSAACFHCQQASEKALKAFLSANDVLYPHIHHLGKLIRLVRDVRGDLSMEDAEISALTVYAVDSRYDEPEPSLVTTESAIATAKQVYSIFVVLIGDDTTLTRDS